ncbi:hypothetical protein LZ30DRAFT_261941 [Colletotrichum cereale]|nr:hypothetical protein LZ30DRAFT_261941 [Colletotrichum cereale]
MSMLFTRAKSTRRSVFLIAICLALFPSTSVSCSGSKSPLNANRSSWATLINLQEAPSLCRPGRIPVPPDSPSFTINFPIPRSILHVREDKLRHQGDTIRSSSSPRDVPRGVSVIDYMSPDVTIESFLLSAGPIAATPHVTSTFPSILIAHMRPLSLDGGPCRDFLDRGVLPGCPSH